MGPFNQKICSSILEGLHMKFQMDLSSGFRCLKMLIDTQKLDDKEFGILLALSHES